MVEEGWTLRPMNGMMTTFKAITVTKNKKGDEQIGCNRQPNMVASQQLSMSALEFKPDLWGAFFSVQDPFNFQALLGDAVQLGLGRGLTRSYQRF